MCNRLQQRRCPAQTSVKVRGQVITRKHPTSSRLHNSDYVKLAPASRCEGSTFELPCEAAAGEGLAAVAGTVPALCQPRTGLRNWGPNFPNCSAPVPSRISVIKIRSTSPATVSVVREHPAALRSSAAGSFQAVTPLPPQAPSEESRPSTPRYGFAVVIPGRYSSTPPPGKSQPEVFRASRWQPFRLLAQTVSEQVRHRLRRRPRISDVSVVLLFEGQCQFANTVVPRINAGAALTGWAVPAQAPEGVCPPAAPAFVGGRGSSGRTWLNRYWQQVREWPSLRCRTSGTSGAWIWTGTQPTAGAACWMANWGTGQHIGEFPLISYCRKILKVLV